MKKTKTMKRVLAVALAAAAALGCAACRGDDGENGGKIDSTKSQLYVRYYNGGVGRTWIDNVISMFEKEYAEVSFETGKKGVEIVKDFDKTGTGVGTVERSQNQVFITLGIDYYDFVSKDVMMDITDVMNDGAVLTPTTKEEKTIASKLSPDLKNFYLMDKGDGAKYYALPFFESSMNLIYNVTLFEDKKLYFAQGTDGQTESWTEERLKSGDVESLFVRNSDPAVAPRSKGPDGKTGVINGVDYSLDDGLPATYNDFQALLTCMVRRNVIPFIWNATSTEYLIGLANDMWANNEGKEQMALNMSFSGTATDLVDMSDLSKTSPATEINGSTAYELHAQRGKLDALRFVKMMMSDSSYRYRESFNMEFRTTQRYFLNGNAEGLTGGKDIAMMVEGTWWNSEARTDYAGEEDRHSENRKYGVLPLPKPTYAEVGTKKTTKVSERKAVIFINKYCADYAVPIAKAFVSYLNSDRIMNVFSKDTDMLRSLNYELTDDTLNGMSYFGRNNYYLSRSENTEWIEWVGTTDTTKRQTALLEWSKYGYLLSDGSANPFTFWKEESNANVTAEQYFKNVYDYYKNSWTVS